MLRPFFVLAVTCLLGACGGSESLNSPDSESISFGGGPTVWKAVGNINHRCEYDSSSKAAQIACLDQLKFIEQALIRLRPERGYGWDWRRNENIYLRCDAPYGTAGEIRACTRQWKQQLEGHPHYLDFSRPDGSAPRVLVSDKY